MLFKRHVHSVVSKAISIILLQAFLVSGVAFAIPDASTHTLATPNKINSITKTVNGIRTEIVFSMQEHGPVSSFTGIHISGTDYWSIASDPVCQRVMNALEIITDPGETNAFMELCQNSYDSFIDRIHKLGITRMDFKGILKIEAYYDGDNVIIKIIDNGEPIELRKDGTPVNREGVVGQFRKEHAAIRNIDAKLTSLGGSLTLHPLEDGTEIRIRIPKKNMPSDFHIGEDEYITIVNAESTQGLEDEMHAVEATEIAIFEKELEEHPDMTPQEVIDKFLGGRIPGGAFRKRWAFAELGICIADMLKIIQKRRKDGKPELNDPKSILIPLIKYYISRRNGMREISLEGYDIDSIEEIRNEKHEIIGFNLPIKRDGKSVYAMRYYLSEYVIDDDFYVPIGTDVCVKTTLVSQWDDEELEVPLPLTPKYIRDLSFEKEVCGPEETMRRAKLLSDAMQEEIGERRIGRVWLPSGLKLDESYAFKCGVIEITCFKVDKWFSLEGKPDFPSPIKGEYVFLISIGQKAIGHGTLCPFKDKAEGASFKYSIHGENKNRDRFRKKGYGKKALALIMAICSKGNILEVATKRLMSYLREHEIFESESARKMDSLLRNAGFLVKEEFDFMNSADVTEYWFDMKQGEESEPITVYCVKSDGRFLQAANEMIGNEKHKVELVGGYSLEELRAILEQRETIEVYPLRSLEVDTDSPYYEERPFVISNENTRDIIIEDTLAGLKDGTTAYCPDNGRFYIVIDNNMTFQYEPWTRWEVYDTEGKETIALITRSMLEDLEKQGRISMRNTNYCFNDPREELYALIAIPKALSHVQNLRTLTKKMGRLDKSTCWTKSSAETFKMSYNKWLSHNISSAIDNLGFLLTKLRAGENGDLVNKLRQQLNNLRKQDLCMLNEIKEGGFKEASNDFKEENTKDNPLPFQNAGLYLLNYAFNWSDNADEKFAEFKEIVTLIEKEMLELEKIYLSPNQTRALLTAPESELVAYKLPQAPDVEGLSGVEKAEEYRLYFSQLLFAIGDLSYIELFMIGQGKKEPYLLNWSDWIKYTLINDLWGLMGCLKDLKKSQEEITYRDSKNAFGYLKKHFALLRDIPKVDPFAYTANLKHVGTQEDPIPYEGALPYYMRKIFVEEHNAQAKWLTFKEAVRRMEVALHELEIALSDVNIEGKKLSSKSTEDFQDAIEYIQAKTEDKSIAGVVLGTSWIEGYNEWLKEKGKDPHFQFQHINPLISSIKTWCEKRNIPFRIEDDRNKEHFLATIEALRGDNPGGKVAVLAAEDTITSNQFKPLRNNKKAYFMVGVNNENLTSDSYIRIVDMLNLTMRLAFDIPIDLDNSHIDIVPAKDTEGHVLYYIFTPHAEPKNYEELRTIYTLQKFA